MSDADYEAPVFLCQVIRAFPLSLTFISYRLPTLPAYFLSHLLCSRFAGHPAINALYLALVPCAGVSAYISSSNGGN
ncbi:hypothetical protein K438DRAFT_1865805 [Mycena galopus ATCC 62051]|nr:hypothetical protein K438DRAFT_1865805 [Mycena galopus ATCC 62051]